MDERTMTRKDAKALWWAVDWAACVLREWKRGGFKDEEDAAKYEHQLQRLLHAKYALRQVQAQVRAAKAAAALDKTGESNVGR